jgi:hypothetical protein
LLVFSIALVRIILLDDVNLSHRLITNRAVV